MTHICVVELTTIGSDNGLSPGRRQAIIWNNAGILLIGPLGTNFNEILIEIHTFSFKKMHLKMSSGKWRPCCLGLNVLIRPKIQPVSMETTSSQFTILTDPYWPEIISTSVQHIFSASLYLKYSQKTPTILFHWSPDTWPSGHKTLTCPFNGSPVTLSCQNKEDPSNLLGRVRRDVAMFVIQINWHSTWIAPETGLQLPETFAARIFNSFAIIWLS